MAEPIVPPIKSVNLVDERTGEVVNVNESDLGQLGAGYRLATDEEVATDLRRQEYGEGLGNELAAFGEGALSGATLGLSDVAARAISDDYADGLAARREFNPTAAGVGEAAGIVGATLLTGGAGGAAQAGGRGLLATGARLATAPTRALVGAGEAATGAVARALGAEAATGVLGQAARQGAAYAAGGALEGALFGAAKVATDDFLQDHEITAERVLTGAKTGALTGGLLGGAIGGGAVLASEGAKALIPKIQKAIEIESVDDFIGERAYKAALGGRNLRDVQRSERLGGPEEIGKTLLAEGVVTPTSTIEDIVKVSREKAEQYGTRIGEIVDELDALEPRRAASVADNAAEVAGEVADSASAPRLDGKALWKRIEEEHIAPLKASAPKKQIGEALEKKLEDIKVALTRDDAPPLTFRDLWTLRKDFDDTLKFEQPPAPFVAPSPTLEGMRDARRTIDSFWQEAGEAAAKEAGNEALMAEFRAAKRSYSHLKHAEEISEKAIARDNANRMLSPSDYGFGAVVAGADVITGGGASLGTLIYGLASGAVHKFFRERGSAMFAGTMYSLRNAPKIVKDARAGEEAIEAAGRGFVEKLAQGAKLAAKKVKSAAEGTAAVLSTPEAYERAARTAAELTDPSSPRRQELKRQAASVRVHNPALADALDAKTQGMADFLAAKTGELSVGPRPGDPFGHLRKPRHDPAKAQKLARYIDAATNPRNALSRIAEGKILREDVETLQTLYPRLYQRMVQEVLMNLSDVDKLPSYDARLKLGVLLQAPTDPSLTPERFAALQQLAQSGVGAAAVEAANTLPPSAQRAPTKLAGLARTRTERSLD